jgi:hypothetical protein
MAGMYAPKSHCPRALLVATTILAVIMSGCASRQAVVPAGQNRTELVAAVERRGQENPDVSNLHQVEGHDKFHPFPNEKVVKDVAKVTACVAVLGSLAVLAALGHGNVSGFNLPGFWSYLDSDS